MEDYVLVVDLEVDLKGDRKDPSPYNKYNELVAIGYLKRNLDGSKIGSLTVQIKNKSSLGLKINKLIHSLINIYIYIYYI